MKFVGHLAVLALLLLATVVAATRDRRPNIVFLLSDDHATQAISCYGSKLARTPQIDRIAAGGMRFDNAFCTESICSPSRAAIMTGKYGHVTAAKGMRAVDDWEFFDLQTDPEEAVNLYGDPADQALVADLTVRLTRLRAELGDPEK